MPRVRLDGGLIGVTNNPSSGSAGGMWSFSEHSKYQRSAGWPAASNPVGSINAIALIVAGGGGGGWDGSGGGGAGGLISNTFNIITNSNYTITVGAGGTFGTALGINGSNGTNSSAFSIVANGGGGGGAKATRGYDGASGGGSGHTFTSNAGLGIVGQGSSGGAGGTDTGGGGGGAGAVGTAGGINLGAGGIGIQSSITGSTLYYAGGGGGGTYQAGRTANPGGSGGGGTGGAGSTAATSGAANTGGGGGGHGNASTGGNPGSGGSGIVIINYPAPQQYTGGTVTNVINAAGSNIVHTFTSSGSLNALGYSIDTYFPQTTLLLHGNEAVGANNTVFLDSAANTFIPAATGTTYSNYFNGSSDYITTPAANSSLFEMGSGDYTVEFWFYALSNSDGGLVFKGLYQSGATWQPGFGVRRLSATQLRFTFNTSGAGAGEKNYDYTTTTNTNQWYHVAMVVSGGVGYAFVNGTLVNSGGLASIGTIGTSSTPITIGAFPYDAGYIYFNGYISNVRILKGTALYTSSFTPPTAPLTAITNTQLLTCQSARFIDNSTNNLTISRTSNPLISSGGPLITTNGKPQQGTFSPFSQTGWSNYLPTQAGGNIVTPSNSAFGLPGVFTLEFFFNAISLTAGSITGVYSAGGFNMYYDGTRITPNLYGTGNIFNSTFTSITLGKWYHIVVRRDASNLMTMYVDGVSVGSTTTSTTYTTGTWAIGNAFPMYISNLRITNTDVYGGTPTVPLSSLTAVTGTQLLTCKDNIFKDNSTNAFALTLAGTPQVQPFSPFSPSSAYSNTAVGGSISFNGSTDYLSSSSNVFGVGSNSFTVEFWLYKNNAWSTGNQYIVDNGATNGMQIWVNTGAGALRLGRYGVDVILDYAYSSLTPNQWYHMAYVRSGTSVALFINGTRVATATSSASFLTSSTTQNIGRSTDTTSYLNGYISNLRVINGIAAYDPAQTTLTVPTAPLTANSTTTFLLNATNAGIIDQTAKNNITTYGSAAISSTQSKFGGTSMYFNGSTDYLQIPASPNIPLLGDFTVECWIYPTTINNNNMILGSDNGGSSDYFQFTSTTVQLAVSAASTPNYPTWSHSFTTNQWYHIAVVRQSGTLSCYVNGVVRTLSSGSASETRQLFISNVALQVGRYGYSVSPWYFSGYIDELRITRGYARYTSNFTPPTSAFLDR